MPQHTLVTCQVLSLLFIMCCANHLVAQTGIVQQQPAFSGNLQVKRNYDDDSKSWYAVYTTGNIIHVYLAVTDPLQQRKIVTNGMELWIDTKGKKNKKTGILFPLAARVENQRPLQGLPPDFNRPGASDNHSGPDTNNIKALETVISRLREMKLTGFKEDLNGVQNIHHPSGIEVSLYFVKDTLVYEAQLPVNNFPEPLSINSRISVCFVEKGMLMPDFGGGQMPPDGGGGGDGMPPPGGPPPGGEDGMRLFQDNIIWYKLVLYNTETL
jgi:hypothetical protein